MTDYTTSHTKLIFLIAGQLSHNEDFPPPPQGFSSSFLQNRIFLLFPPNPPPPPAPPPPPPQPRTKHTDYIRISDYLIDLRISYYIRTTYVCWVLGCGTKSQNI